MRNPRDGPPTRPDELAAREATELLDLLVADVRDHAILVLDTDGRVVSWNLGAQRLKGYTADEIIGRHFSAFYTAADVAAGKPDRELRIAAAEGRLEDEGWRVRRDATRFWANVVITALRDPDGTLRGYGKVTRDLTARRAAEERMRASFDHALIAMMDLDLDGRYVRVNDAFCALVGRSREQLEGVTQESVTHPDDAAADACALRSLRAGDASSHTAAKRYTRADGHAVWTQTTITLIHGDDGLAPHLIAQAQDITAQREHAQRLQHMADHDPLTGLMNRRSFQRELDGHVARIARYGATGAVLMLDLDNFKHVNDSSSHSVGDQLIVRIAQGLQARLRGSDVVARLGGDEFAVLLPAADEHKAQTVADALLRLVREEAMPALTSPRHPITASIGIANFDDDTRCLGSDEVMVNADLAMYEAKHRGRDRWAYHRSARDHRPVVS